MRILLYYRIIKSVFELFLVSTTLWTTTTAVVPGYGDETRNAIRLFSPVEILLHSFHKRSQISRRRRAQSQQNMYFVYARAPKHLILPARRNGEIERTSFTNSASMMNNGDERMELYAKHFSQCSQIDDKPSEDGDNEAAIELENEIERSSFADNVARIDMKKSIDPNSAVEVLTDAIGIEESTAKLFAISSPSLLTKTIRRACLKNELKFQCAFGFLNDLDKISEHIHFMKQNDGNFKVMLENECKSLEKLNGNYLNPKTSIYACVNQNAPEILTRCRTSIEMYNQTRQEINNKMKNTFTNTLAAMEKHVNQAMADGDADKVQRLLKQEQALIVKTLNELSYSEAFKCRQYAFMEKCVLEEVTNACSVHAANSLRTILRVGYLTRERGAELHQQFLEAGVPEHRACNKFVIHENETNSAIRKRNL